MTPPGTSPGPSTRRHPTEAVRRVTPARPRATKPSRGIDQLPRSWPLRLRAASSPSRARSQSATEPDAPHTIFTWLVLTPRKAAIVNGPTNFGKNLGCSPRNDRCSDDNNTSSPSQYVCPRLAWVFRSLGQTLVEGQPWVPVGSTVGPRFLAGIRGSPQKIRQRWVPVAPVLAKNRHINHTGKPSIIEGLLKTSTVRTVGFRGHFGVSSLRTIAVSSWA